MIYTASNLSTSKGSPFARMVVCCWWLSKVNHKLWKNTLRFITTVTIIHSLKITASLPLNISWNPQKRMDCLPINFQVRTVSFREGNCLNGQVVSFRTFMESIFWILAAIAVGFLFNIFCIIPETASRNSSCIWFVYSQPMIGMEHDYPECP